MKTKVINCGNYNCSHCYCDGTCLLRTIALDASGKCVLFDNKSQRREQSEPINEMDEHTNMC